MPGPVLGTICGVLLCSVIAVRSVVVRSRGRHRARGMFVDGAVPSSLSLCRERMGGWLRKGMREKPEWLCLPVALAVAVLGRSVLPLPAGVVAVPLVRRWLRRRASRRVREIGADSVVTLCGAVVGELRAGREPGRALLLAVRGTEAMRAAEKAGVSAAARFGGDVPEALRQASRVPGLDGLAGVAACWRVAVDGGAGLAAGLDRLEGALRAERRRREELRAQLAGAWSTVTVLALLPVLGLGLGAALGAEPLQVLFHTPAGLACLVVGGVLETAGLCWAGRIVRAGEAV
ncbi:type II secretion system F family protein [Streptomyces sp. NPDC014734]|uniref:type II secretion system F family protein n=1 Tax=Streptomyces sp. NPDC014734 TaxID=3364886 RepID=UPI0036FD8EA2